MNKFIEKLVSMTMTQILVFSLGIGGMYYVFIYNDGASFDATLLKLNADRDVQEAKKKETDSILKEEKRIKALVGTLATQFQTVSKKLPTQLSMIEMNRQIAIFSQTSRTRVKNNAPQAIVKKEIIDEVPVKITIDDATFGEIALFIFHASVSERLVRIRDFVINRNEKAKLKFEGTIIGYRLNAEDPKKEEAAK